MPAVYQTVRPSGTIDTLHAGTWGHAGNHALRLGIGYWGIARRPLIWDRWFIELQGTRNAATSTFDGLVANADSILQPNTLLDSGRSVVTTELTFKLQRAFEIKTDFFFEAQLGSGGTGNGAARSAERARTAYLSPEPHRRRIALHWNWVRGSAYARARTVPAHPRHVRRIAVGSLAEEGNGRVQWYEGHYQPWNLTLQWDLLRPSL